MWKLILDLESGAKIFKFWWQSWSWVQFYCLEMFKSLQFVIRFRVHSWKLNFQSSAPVNCELKHSLRSLIHWNTKWNRWFKINGSSIWQSPACLTVTRWRAVLCCHWRHVSSRAASLQIHRCPRCWTAAGFLRWNHLSTELFSSPQSWLKLFSAALLAG